MALVRLAVFPRDPRVIIHMLAGDNWITWWVSLDGHAYFRSTAENHEKPNDWWAREPPVDYRRRTMA